MVRPFPGQYPFFLRFAQAIVIVLQDSYRGVVGDGPGIPEVNPVQGPRCQVGDLPGELSRQWMCQVVKRGVIIQALELGGYGVRNFRPSVSNIDSLRAA